MTTKKQSILFPLLINGLAILAMTGCDSDKSSTPPLLGPGQDNPNSNPASAKTDELVTKEPIRHSTQKWASSIGVYEGVFVWVEQDPKTKSQEVFTTILGDSWKPKSLGSYADSSFALVGSKLFRSSDEGELWSSELPNGPFVKAQGIKARVHHRSHKSTESRSHYYMFGVEEVLQISKEDGLPTVIRIPKAPDNNFASELIGVEGNRFLFWTMDNDNDKSLGWFDFQNNKWTFVKKATANEGFVHAEHEGDGTSNGINPLKNPYTACRANKHAIVCTKPGKDQEVVSETGQKGSQIVTDGKWVIWQEEDSKNATTHNFFALPLD